MVSSFTMTKPRTRILVITVGIVAGYGLLAVPAPTPTPPPAGQQPFYWNQDERWLALEQRFREAGALGCDRLREPVDRGLTSGDSLLAEIAARGVEPDDPLLDRIEENTFELAPLVGVCLERLSQYIQLVTRTRSVVKRQSERWDIATSKERLYRLIWGGRAAVEEVMLQGPPEAVPPLVLADDEPSATPSTRILGVTIHSGDLLVSRGGAPTSALIAVGSDYPGNFSHVALVHVDEETSLPTVIQSNQRGLHTSTLDEYLDEVKLRVMVLRVRADLPGVAADPMLPHRAAMRALERARREHIPYDFAIDHSDDARMYCSEVPAWAYRQLGTTLWMDISRVSAPGTRQWLAALGVERFDMQEPSDLEYDPQLRVVAEWRDPETLYLDHVDNVVVEALLDGANRGDRLTHRWYLLPFIRVIKGYSTLLNVFGRQGPIPEGLSATAAARILTWNGLHDTIKQRVLVLADAFQQREGYRPPEWQLGRFARQARDEMR